MAVNTTEITNVYSSLLTAMVAKYDDMWTSNEIDAETYAKMVGQASSQLVQLAAELVQAQEGLDVDKDLKLKQIELADKDLLLKDKDLTIRDEELALRAAEVDRIRDTTEAELEKQWGYTVDRDPNDNSLVLGGSTGTGRIDSEVQKLQTDIGLGQEQIDIAKAQADKEYALTHAVVDKELGYDFTLNPDGTINRDTLSDAGDGKLDAEIAKAVADASLAEEQVGIAKANLASEKAKTIAAVVKEYGYDYTTDADGNITVTTSTGTGQIDYQIINLQKEGSLLDEQYKTTHTDRVLKDKQAAKLGLDNVMKQSETARDADANFVYTPRYEEQV